MRYRPLGPNGEYTVSQPWLVNSPACVAQAVLTRLKLWTGEWFLDVTAGTPYLTQVLGERHSSAPVPVKDPGAAIRQRILGTLGVTSIAQFGTRFEGTSRQLQIAAVINTLYGPASLSTSITL